MVCPSHTWHRTTSQTQGGLETEEQQTSKNSGNTLHLKDFTYDVHGHRLAMTDTPYNNGVAGTPTTSTYGYDVHGSVSQLVDSSGNTTESYGYTPYGQSDSQLTQLSQGNTDKTTPLNPFRYSAKRMDTGSGTLDMGARRFGPDVAHFLTPDFFYGSLSNLSLSIDPLTQNRYDLAGGNPISFVDSTGHAPCFDAGFAGAALAASLVHGPRNDLGRCLAPTVRGADVWTHYSDDIRQDAQDQDVEPWILASVLAHESSGGKNNGPGPFLFENLEIFDLRLNPPVGPKSASLGLGRVQLYRAEELQAAGYMPKASRNDTIRQLLDDRTNITNPSVNK